ncbi:MAG TPA: V-type ATPase 116kDa subunit family protein, partial [Solirubrobacteraceae bacterium]|nr:V-type ATPase 116kDa subunit family protein [Solirubrobacteraceae bacterium]
GVVQLVGPLPAPEGDAVEALRRLERAPARNGAAAGPRVAESVPALGALERDGRRDLLAGEVELQRRAGAAVRRAGFAALVAWMPSAEVAPLGERLAPLGCAVVELPRPAFVEPPTLLREHAFRPLVDTFGAARYADIDPTPFAAATFVLMFGMMFGDAGHGLVLAGLGLALRTSRSPRLRGVRALWPFLVAGGLAATFFGLLYGEFFGPTGIVPTLWLEPLEEPVRLLAAAVAVGALLLAAGYAIGIVNRHRESGWSAALLAPSGVAGLGVLVGGSVLAAGIYASSGALAAAGIAITAGAIVLLFAGFVAEAGFSGAAVAQALIEVFDAVLRVGANLVSFTRLAAFGLMHAALGAIVLDGARGLWEAGGAIAMAGAVLLFVAGNAVAFTLELLVAAVQAMRLEYYELFSRVYAGQGEPFTPWRIAVTKEAHQT